MTQSSLPWASQWTPRSKYGNLETDTRYLPTREKRLMPTMLVKGGLFLSALAETQTHQLSLSQADFLPFRERSREKSQPCSVVPHALLASLDGAAPFWAAEGENWFSPAQRLEPGSAQAVIAPPCSPPHPRRARQDLCQAPSRLPSPWRRWLSPFPQLHCPRAHTHIPKPGGGLAPPLQNSLGNAGSAVHPCLRGLSCRRGHLRVGPK